MDVAEVMSCSHTSFKMRVICVGHKEDVPSTYPSIVDKVIHLENLSGLKEILEFNPEAIVCVSEEKITDNPVEWIQLLLTFPTHKICAIGLASPVGQVRIYDSFKAIFKLIDSREWISSLFNREYLVRDKFVFRNFIKGKIIHGVNNRFLALSGGLQMLKMKHSQDAELCNLLDEIKLQNDNAVDLVQQIRGVNNRNFATELQPSLIQTIRNLIQFWKHEMDLNQIHFEMSYNLDKDFPIKEPRELWVSLAILLENAIDSVMQVESRSIKCSISVTSEMGERGSLYGNPKPGSFLLIEIEDTGVGINESDIKSIFDTSYSTKGPDHGYSLSVVKEFACRHGRWVHASSTLGAGAIFTIGLPIESDSFPYQIETLSSSSIHMA